MTMYGEDRSRQVPSVSPIVLEKFLPYRLNRLASAISRRMQQIYRREFDLSVAEWRVLASLAQFPSATATAIGQHSDMHKTKVSRAVSALEARRWLRRHTAPEDAREQTIELTQQGWSVYRRLVPRLLSFEAMLCDQFTEHDQATFSSALGRLEQFLGSPAKAISSIDRECVK